MASIIDDKLGREALVETVKTGPRSFISEYNNVAEDEMKLLHHSADAVKEMMQAMENIERK